MVLGVLFAAIESVYVFYISSGTWAHWADYTQFYDLFAEGLRKGHLYLAVAPSAELLAQPNPFDPKNISLWFWDASLHNGHYYIYWGPLPGLLLAAVKIALRIRTPVGDDCLVFAFFTISLVCGALLIDRIGRRLFPAAPAVLVPAAILVFAFANPTPYMLARAAVYEAAIVGGQAFLLLGLLFAFDAVSAGPAPGPGRQLPRAKLALAGSAWALALACRVSLAAAVLLLGVAAAITAVHALGPDRGWRDLARALAWVGVPLAVGEGALLLYNHARFGEWLEFGNHKQLTNWLEPHSLAYLPSNVYSYAARPFQHGCAFPFLTVPWNMTTGAFPRWLTPAAGYLIVEPTTGVLRAVPWSWLGAVALASGGRAAWRHSRAGGPEAALDRAARARLWCIASFVIAAAASLAPTMTWFGTTMRYLGDATPGLLLLSTMGAGALVDEAGQGKRPRRIAIAFCLVLAGATMIMGLLLGMEGYYASFKVNNPALYAKLVAKLSLCGR